MEDISSFANVQFPVNQKYIIMASICAIELGGHYAKEISDWLSSDDVLPLLSSATRKRIIDKITSTLEQSKSSGQHFNIHNWASFAQKNKSFPAPLDASPINTPLALLAVAIFFAANSEGKAMEDILELEEIKGKVPASLFHGLLTLGLEYNSSLIDVFVEKEGGAVGNPREDCTVQSDASEKITPVNFYDAVISGDIKQIEAYLAESPTPALDLAGIVNTKMFESYLKDVSLISNKAVLDLFTRFSSGKSFISHS